MSSGMLEGEVEINKKKKKTYLCKDKIPLAMVLGCIYIYIYWSHVYTDLGDTIGKH